jgi:hypothetical protein
MKKHPYDKYIRAFLDGKVVQFRANKEDKWELVTDLDWFTSDMDYTCANEFRILPDQKKSIGYRRFLWQRRDGEILVSILRETEPDGCDYWQEQSSFIEWIDTEWQYHIVTLDKPKKF